MRNARLESDYRPQGRPFTGRKMLLTVVAFFAVIIAANMTMLFSALDAWPGLVVKNSYIASQQFEEARAAVAARDARGWNVALDVPGGRPEVVLADAEGTPLTGLDVGALAYRPATAADDRTLAFTEIAPGRYRAGGVLATGRWGVALRIEGDGEPWLKSFELTVR